MNGKADSDSNKTSWPESVIRLLDVFENLALFIFKVEWLTPVGKMNVFCSLGMIFIVSILAIRGIVQNNTLEILCAFLFVCILSVIMSSRSNESNEQQKLEVKLGFYK